MNDADWELNMIAVTDGGAVGLVLVALTVTGASPKVTPAGAAPKAMF